MFEFVRWFFNEKVRKVDMEKFVFICVFLIIVNQALLFKVEGYSDCQAMTLTITA